MRKRKKRSKRKLPKSSSGVRVRRCGQGSRSRSSSSCGCGRLCEHVRHVPAVADLQWKVPPSISSTKWWTFQLCYGDRYGCLQVQFLDNVVFLPGIVQRLALLVLTVQIFALAPQFYRRSTASLRAAEANPHGPACSGNHRDSAVAVGQVVDAPVVLVVRFHRLFISVYSAMLGSTVDTKFCVSLRRYSRFST